MRSSKPTSRTICEVIDFGGKTRGGFIPSMLSLSQALRARGDRFVVLSSDIPGVTWYDEVRAAADLRLIHSARELPSALKEIRPDVVHSHFNKYDVAVALSAFHTPVIWHVHSFRESFSLVDEVRGRLKYMLIGSAVRQWLCASGGVAKQVLEYGARKSRVRVVHNGIDTSFFRPPTRDERAQSRAQFGVGERDRVVLFFDRTAVKGGSVLRDALTKLGGCRLLLSSLNGEAEDDWLAFAQRNDVIRAPYLSDPRPLYWAADAFALASYGEGGPFVMIEAAASGLPVATTGFPSAIETLEGCDGAFFCPVGDSDALARSLAHAIEYGPAEALRERVVTSFSLGRWTRDVLSVYDAV